MSLRTDLARESISQHGSLISEGGISHTEENENGLSIFRTRIFTKQASDLLSKPRGSYVTISSQAFSLESTPQEFKQRSDTLARELGALCEGARNPLVVCLGNRDITPDSLGPLVSDRLLATRHIHRLAKDIDTKTLGNLSVIAPSVMGKTGIEALETVKAVAGVVKPDVIVAVDALACCEGESLGGSIQLCDTGISPGSGVENARAELSQKTLGIRVVAVGVPTVIDAKSLCGGSCDTIYSSMFVTPRNIDSLVRRMSTLVAMGINRAFHPSLSVDEIVSLV